MAAYEGREVGNYRLVRELGKGGMGRVYLAEHERIGRRVAIKFMRAKMAGHPDLVQRFFNEALAANRVAHPGIVEVYDGGVDEDLGVYLVMELLAGEALDARLSREPPGVETACAIVAQVADALSAAHQKGIVHRDLKPANVFLLGGGGDQALQTKLVDFGLAKLEEVRGPTRAGAQIGTPRYMSPEQFKDSATVDHRTDIYSLGLIAYRLLAGRGPFDELSGMELVKAHLLQAPDPPSLHNGAISAAADAALLRAVAKAPQERFATVAAFARALDEASAEMRGRPVPVHATARPRPPSPKTLPPDAEDLGEPPTREMTVPTGDGRPGGFDAVTDPEADRPYDGSTDDGSADDGSADDGSADGAWLPDRLARARQGPGPAKLSSGAAAGLAQKGPPRPADTLEEKPTVRLEALGPAAPEEGVRVDELESVPTLRVDAMAPAADDPPARPSAEPTGKTRRPRSRTALFFAAAVVVVLVAAVVAWLLRPGPERGTAVRPSRVTAVAPAGARAGGDAAVAPRREARRARPGRRLWLTTKPSGAVVSADGVSIGKTPLVGVELGAEVDAVVIAKPGYASRRIPLGPERQWRVRLQLERAAAVEVPRSAASGQLHVVVLQGGRMVAAEITLDGRVVGQAPLFLERVAAGRRRVVVRRAGFVSIHRSALIRAGAVRKLVLELRRDR